MGWEIRAALPSVIQTRLIVVSGRVLQPGSDQVWASTGLRTELRRATLLSSAVGPS